MTTATTMLAIGLGSGAEIMQPFALCVICGLLVSMFLTLFLVPCLYLTITGSADRLRRVITAR